MPKEFARTGAGKNQIRRQDCPSSIPEFLADGRELELESARELRFIGVVGTILPRYQFAP